MRMTRNHFNLLESLRATCAGMDPVFVPYWGRTRDDMEYPRIMVCGKATYGWEDGIPAGTYKGQQDQTNQFVNDVLVPGDYRSLYWIFAWEMVYAGLHPDRDLPDHFDQTMRSKLADSIFWTNISKIGYNGGNLPQGILRDNWQLLKEILVAEVTCLMPRVVVFTTGNYGFDQLTNLAGGEDIWIKDGRPVGRDWCFRPQDFWYCKAETLSPASPWLVWTRHPQGWPRAARRDAARCIGELAQVKV